MHTQGELDFVFRLNIKPVSDCLWQVPLLFPYLKLNPNGGRKCLFPYTCTCYVSCHPGGVSSPQCNCHRYDVLWLLQMGLKVGMASAWLSWDVHTCNQVTRLWRSPSKQGDVHTERPMWIGARPQLPATVDQAVPLQHSTARHPESDSRIPSRATPANVLQSRDKPSLWALAKWKIHKQN